MKQVANLRNKKLRGNIFVVREADFLKYVRSALQTHLALIRDKISGSGQIYKKTYLLYTLMHKTPASSRNNFALAVKLYFA